MKAKITLTAFAVSLLLSACGGGGGGGSSTTAPTPPVTPPVVTPPVVTPPANDLQTSVPAATYAAGSQELAFFTALNEFRSKLGLGLLAQNPKLDTANQNHLKYLLSNPDVNFSAVDPKTGRPFFHLEDPVRLNFTGVTELDRAKFTQYSGIYVGETGAYGRGQGAVTAISDLIGTVYHRSGLMFQFPREIGISAGSDIYQTMVITFGYQTTRQRNTTDYFGAYPADRQTGVPRVAYIETPNPFPEISLNEFNEKTSFPINVVSEASTALVVNTFTVTEAGQTTPLETRLLTKDSDPNKQLAANAAYLVGKAPFKPNTTYNVRFEGSVNGASKQKSWSFTTGS